MSIIKRNNFQTYNFTIEHYINLKNNNKLVFQSLYQRDLVWNMEQKKSFIENICNNVPFGSIIIKRPIDEIDYYEIIDGQQRINTVLEFINSSFPIFDNIFYKNFEKVDVALFERILVTTIDVLNFSEQEIVSYYITFNSLGLRHTIEDIEKAKKYLQIIQNKPNIT